jgi:hypothetical protein
MGRAARKHRLLQRESGAMRSRDTRGAAGRLCDGRSPGPVRHAPASLVSTSCFSEGLTALKAGVGSKALPEVALPQLGSDSSSRLGSWSGARPAGGGRVGSGVEGWKL